MVDFYSLSNMDEDLPPAMIEAMEEFVKITGISRMVVREAKAFGAAGVYTELLEKLATFLPNDIEISQISGFSRSEIENRSKTRTRLHIHFNVNTKPCCISIDGRYRSFEESFLIQLNNILCTFTQPERFLFVFPGGLDYIDPIHIFAYLRPDVHAELKKHKLVFAEDYGGSGQLDEEYPLSDCELPINEQTDTVIRPIHEVTSDSSALRFVRAIDNVALYDINQHGIYHHTKNGSVPEIIDFDDYRENRGGHMKLYDDLLYCRNGCEGGAFLYDLTKKQFLFKQLHEVDGKRIHHLGEQLWDKYVWSVSCTSDDSDFKRDGYFKDDAFALNVHTNTLTPMEMGVRHSLDEGRLLLGYVWLSKFLNRIDKEGRIIWTYSIDNNNKITSERGTDKRVKKVFGLHNNLIWFSIYSGEIIAVSEETGEEKHVLKNVEHAGLILDNENSQLVSERLRVDLTCSTLTVEKIDIQQESVGNSETRVAYLFHPHTDKIESQVVNNRLFVIDRHNSIIGLQDLATSKYLWQYYLFETTDHIGIASAKRYENMLCVLDGCSTLHIFEINEKWL